MKKASERTVKWQRRMIEQGRCMRCSKDSPDINPGTNKRHVHCAECRIKRSKRSHDYRREVVDKFFRLYGNKCNCCGESDWHFLTLDHVKNNGAAIRRKDGSDYPSDNRTQYQKAINEYNPEEFQILCWNCNCAKYHHGECPHKNMNKS